MSSQPPRHGQLSLTTWKPTHAKKHLAAMVKSGQEMADYHAPNATTDYGSHSTGYSSQGAFSAGGAAGADYETSSADSGTSTSEW